MDVKKNEARMGLDVRPREGRRMNEADVKEMTLLIKLHISQGEQYFIDGERSIDAEKIARALLIDGSMVYSISN